MAVREKYTLEYSLNAKPELIYNYISTASGLSGWFADDVHINGDQFKFFWEGSVENANLIKKKQGKSVRFHWIDREDEEYLSFDIEQDDLTGDTALIITDYDDVDQLEEAKLMWDSAVEALKGTIGG